MDLTSRLITDLIVRLLFALPAIYFLIHGFTANTRSRRLANLAIFCGIALFTLPENVIAELTAVERSTLLFVSGSLRVLLACSGVGLAIAAALARHDGGITVGRAIVGGGLSVLHLIVGAGMLLFGLMNRPGTAWTYQSPDGLVQLTIPSEQWKQVPDPDRPGRITFTRRVPMMRASIMAINKEQSEAGFIHAAQQVRTTIESNLPQDSKIQWREGENSAGNPFRFCTVIEKPGSDEAVFFAHSITWCRPKRLLVEVAVEAPLTMKSEAGKASAMEAILKSAEAICLSVE